MKLDESKELQRSRHEGFRREIAVGIEEANRGDLAPLDIKAIKREVRRRLAKKRA